MNPYKNELVKAAAKVIRKYFLEGSYDVDDMAEKIVESQLAVGKNIKPKTKSKSKWKNYLLL